MKSKLIEGIILFVIALAITLILLILTYKIEHDNEKVINVHHQKDSIEAYKYLNRSESSIKN